MYLQGTHAKYTNSTCDSFYALTIGVLNCGHDVAKAVEVRVPAHRMHRMHAEAQECISILGSTDPSIVPTEVGEATLTT